MDATSVIKDLCISAILELTKKIFNKIKSSNDLYTILETTKLELSLSDDKVIKQVFENLNSRIGLYDTNSIASNIKPDNGFIFLENLILALKEEFKKFNLEEDKSNYLVDLVCKKILNQLKIENPKIYKEIVTQKTYELQNSYLKELISIKSNLEKMQNFLLNFKTYDELNHELLCSTDNRISLKFFESDDKKFSEFILESVKSNQNNINLISNFKTETMYMVVFELHKLGFQSVVVYDSETWNKMKDFDLKDCVYIANFGLENVLSLPNKICLFISDTDNNKNLKNSFNVRRRLRSSLYNNLKKMDVPSEDIDDILNSTHGYFYPLLRKFIIIPFGTELNIDHEDLNDILFGCLIEKWSNSKYDREFIERFTKKEYLSFVGKISKYTKGDNPLFAHIDRYYDGDFFIINPEDRLPIIEDCISTIIVNYLNFLYAEFDSNRWHSLSKTLLEGIFESLRIIYYLYANVEIKSIIYNFVSHIIKNLNSEVDYEIFSNFACIALEISPNVLLEKIQTLIENNDINFISLFNTSEFISIYSAYSAYISCLIRLMLNNNYYRQSLLLLFKLADKCDKEKFEKVYRNLVQIFSTRYCLTCLTQDEKISFLSQNYKTIKLCKKVLFDNLIINGSSIFDIPRLKFLDIDIEQASVTYNSMIWCLKEYINIALSMKNLTSDETLTLIRSFEFIDVSFFKENFSRVIDLINAMSDVNKEIIKTGIRKELWHYYRWENSDSSETSSKAYYNELEVLKNEIKLTEDEFNYLYLFSDYSDFVPVNIKKMNDKPINDEKLDEFVVKTINNKINEFKQKKLSLDKLISLDKSNTSQLGYYIHLFTEKVFSIEDLNRILVNSNNQIILQEYVSFASKKDKEYLYDTIDFLIKNNRTDLVSSIIRVDIVDDTILRLIENISEEDKQNIFTQYLCFDNKLDSIKIFDLYCKFGDVNTQIEFLYKNISSFSTAKIFKCLILIADKYNVLVPNLNSMTPYYLKNILNRLNKDYFNENDKLIELANIEFKFIDILRQEELVSLNMIITRDEKYFFEFFKYLIKEKNNNDLLVSKKRQYIFHLIYDLKFFPTNNAGELNEEFFNKWMNSFKEDFIKNGISIDIFEDYSGKILNNAKGGKNGLPINDIACKYIESHYSTNLANGFIVSELNKRPFHRFTNGEDELTLSSQYDNYSKILKANKYFKSALIYKKLSEIYAKEADEYRKYGEN